MHHTMSDLIVDVLKSAEVQRIYGIPGDTIDTLMESIRQDEQMEFILTRHEANAGFMASGEARITGKLAVAVACQGPGANNLLNGLADAAGDGVPVLAITGQVDTALIATGMPQGSNQIALFDEIACYNAEARSAENLIEILHIAINAALQGGVAHISIPSDIMRHKALPYKKVPFVYRRASLLHPDPSSIVRAAEAINQAAKVAILYGEGARGSTNLITTLAENIKAPLIHTTRAKDIIDNHHPQIFGGIGLMGSHPANEALHACELLIIIGSNYAYKEFYPTVPIIKIDCNPLHLAAHVAVDYPILADTKAALEALLPKIAVKTEAPLLHGLQKSIAEHMERFIFDPPKREAEKPIHPATLVSEVMAHIQEDTIVCGDSGSATIWINNTARFNGKQRFIWSANLATLGAALGQAMGAALCSQKEVVVIAGDGGFSFSISDLVTAALYEIPVKCFILNNQRFKFIEFEEQTHDGNVPYGTKLLNPDFAALAESSYCKGITVHTTAQLKEAVLAAFAHPGPVVVDCMVDPDALLIPPAVTPKMAYLYVTSEIKSWFTPTEEIENRIRTMMHEKMA